MEFCFYLSVPDYRDMSVKQFIFLRHDSQESQLITMTELYNRIMCFQSCSSSSLRGLRVRFPLIVFYSFAHCIAFLNAS